jgi:hypothetical protein
MRGGVQVARPSTSGGEEAGSTLSLRVGEGLGRARRGNSADLPNRGGCHTRTVRPFDSLRRRGRGRRYRLRAPFGAPTERTGGERTCQCGGKTGGEGLPAQGRPTPLDGTSSSACGRSPFLGARCLYEPRRTRGGLLSWWSAECLDRRLGGCRSSLCWPVSHPCNPVDRVTIFVG